MSSVDWYSFDASSQLSKNNSTNTQAEIENFYVGVNGKARQVTDMYVGVNGKARKVTAIYVGVNGKARKVYESS